MKVLFMLLQSSEGLYLCLVLIAHLHLTEFQRKVPFLLLRISFPGRLIFIQLPPVRQVRRLSVRFLPREPEFHDVQVQKVPGSLQQPPRNPESHREGPQGSGVLRLDRLGDNFHPSKSKYLCVINCNTLIQGGPSAGIVGMGWVPQSCPVDQPAMPLSHQPKQNQADGGTAQLISQPNPTI